MKAWGALHLLPLALAVALAAAQTAHTQQIEWIRQFGTPAEDYAEGIAVYASGVYVAGSTRGALPGQTHAGSADAFVRKYDFEGNEVWTRQFGSPANDFGNAVSADTSGVCVAGWTAGALPGQTSAGESDAFVRKYDHNGNQVWTRQFGGQYSIDYARAVSVHHTGVYVAGGTWGALPGQTNAGSLDAFVRKYDLDGNDVWTRQFGGSLSPGIPFDNATGISVHDSGVYVAGWTSGALPGQTDVPGDSGFVRKYDHNGNEVWTRQFGPPTIADPFIDGTPVEISADGSGVYVATTVWSEPDWWRNGFVRKYDHDGNAVWTDRFAISDSDDLAYGISADTLEIYVAGRTWGAGAWNAFVRKYDPEGNEVWTRQFGNSSLGAPRAVSADATGIYVAGNTSRTLPGQSSAGGSDAFVAKLTENQPPVAEAGPDRTVIAGEYVAFDATASSDPDGTLVSYEWDFGDGGSATGSVVSNTYVSAGTYEVVLTVTDNGGLTATDTAAITVMTPAQAIQQVSGMVASFNFHQGLSNSLGAKLRNAFDAVAAANTHRRHDARNKLQAFINAVQARRDKEITSAQADELTALAMRILAAL